MNRDLDNPRRMKQCLPAQSLAAKGSRYLSFGTHIFECDVQVLEELYNTLCEPTRSCAPPPCAASRGSLKVALLRHEIESQNAGKAVQVRREGREQLPHRICLAPSKVVLRQLGPAGAN